LNIKLRRDLLRMWTQVLAIALIMTVGTAAYVVLIGAANAIQQTQVDYYERNHFANIFGTAEKVPDYVTDRIRQIDGVGLVTTAVAETSLVELPNQFQPANCQAVSAPAVGDLNQLYIRDGRTPQPGSRTEVMVSESFATANNLKPGDTLWLTMKGYRAKYQVVGTALSPEYVFYGVPGAMIPDDRLFGILWFDRRLLEDLFEMKGYFNRVSMSRAGDVAERDITNQLDAILQPYGGTGAFGRSEHISHVTIDGQIQRLHDTVKYSAPVFVGLIGFLLHMLMMRHVETERGQIGAMKAFGFTNGDIVWHYVKFLLIIVAAGLGAGMFIGAQLGEAATLSYTRRFHFPFISYSIDPWIYLQAMVVQLGGAMIGCLQSLRAAATLPPAVAMRPPPPPVYKRTWVESLTQRFIPDQPTRMIIRYIVRWPLRTLMTMLAVAGSMALLIAPMGQMSSYEHLYYLLYTKAERQDLFLAFGKTPKFTAAMSVAHFPGAQVVEPVRNAAARLVFNDRQRKVMVLGRQEVNELSRPLDAEGEPINVGKEGIIISVSMAEYLGARTGDLVTVKFFDGHQPTMELPIIALFENHIGMSFFMTYVDIHMLNRVLREGNVITGVNVKADPLEMRAIYKKVKESPAVMGSITSSGSREAMTRSIRQTLQMSWFNLAIAGLLVFGAIYNSARISFAERSRDFAGMRLLGYTRTEVAYILMGELIILALLSLPLGCGLGYYLAYLWTDGASNTMFRLTLAFEWKSIGYAVLSVFGLVLLSGAIMTRSVFKLDLIAALKTKD
jgi:putative ABC transport system permease protein